MLLTAGYPFDIVTEADGSSSSSVQGSLWGRWLSYAAASYHLPLTIGFSIADRGNFVWGGAVLMRAAALEEQPPLHLWQQQQQQRQTEAQQKQAAVPSILQVGKGSTGLHGVPLHKV
jgi:hypothetical protein